MGLADYIKNEMPKWPNWINGILLKMNILGSMVYGRGYKSFRQTMEMDNPDKALLEIVNYAIENVPYYRKKYGELRIASKKEFEEKIDFIDKDEVMKHWDDFLVDNIDWNKCITGTTGGTSGKPLKLVLPKNRYIHSMAFWHKELEWFGWNFHVRGVMRNHKLPIERDYMINPIMKEVIFDAFRIDDEYSLKIWRILKRKNIEYIHAYPSAFYQFLKFCKKQNLDVSFIKACFLASEGVTEVQRRFIKDEMKINIYSFYGHSEKLIMAGNCPDCDCYHIEDSYGYCELIDDKGNAITSPGIMGEMVGTTFTNKYFPLIRYRTGDYSQYSKIQACPSHGGQYKLLDGVIGRWDKSLIYRFDGTTTSITALNLHGEIYEHIDGMQYIQEEKGKLRVLVIKNELFTNEDELYMIEHHVNAMKSSEGISIEYVDKLEMLPNGKFLPLISKVKLKN